jgi:tryptophan synthase beta chain
MKRCANGCRVLVTPTTAWGRSWARTPFRGWCGSSQSVIGSEASRQLRERGVGTPDVVVACVGGGSNAAGIFSGFANTPAQLIGVEAAGGSAIGKGSPGVLHGMRSMLMQSDVGQIEEAHSISAGLDYPGIGPEHAHLAATGRARYVCANDDEVLDALQLLSKLEGIIPALESAHAVAWVQREAGHEIALGSSVLINLSGRGDKDVAEVREILGRPS